MSQMNFKFENEQQSSGILRQLLEMIKCAVSDDEHIYKEPVSLSCGHYICRSCIPASDDKISCRICGDENINNLRSSKVSAIAQFSIQSNLEKLISLTKQELRNFFQQLQGN
jgi:hypothetical protein